MNSHFQHLFTQYTFWLQCCKRRRYKEAFVNVLDITEQRTNQVKRLLKEKQTNKWCLPAEMSRLWNQCSGDRLHQMISCMKPCFVASQLQSAKSNWQEDRVNSVFGSCVVRKKHGKVDVFTPYDSSWTIQKSHSALLKDYAHVLQLTKNHTERMQITSCSFSMKNGFKKKFRLATSFTEQKFGSLWSLFHWNMLPTTSYLTCSRYVRQALTVSHPVFYSFRSLFQKKLFMLCTNSIMDCSWK